MDIVVSELLRNYKKKSVTELLKKVSSCTFDLDNEDISPIEYLRRCRQPQSCATRLSLRSLYPAPKGNFLY